MVMRWQSETHTLCFLAVAYLKFYSLVGINSNGKWQQKFPVK